jgi:hypothetical protein
MALQTASDLKNEACRILRERCQKQHTEGYVSQWQDNLLPGISPVWCESDLRQGSGNELDTKFPALHSSSALAVNTFASFKPHPQKLELLGQIGFDDFCFEKKLPTGLTGTPPNLDVWLKTGERVIAVESKFLEYFTSKQAKFSDSYQRQNLPQLCDEASWERAIDQAKKGPQKELDTAQLIKHALGLLNYLQAHPGQTGTLLYLFWEPADAANHALFCRHRAQIADFAASVQGSKLRFQAMSYPELWSQWLQNPATKSHAVAVMERYYFSLR